MAFEVTTKKETKKVKGSNIIFYFSLIMLIGAVLAFFIFTYYIEQANNEKSELDKKITEQKSKNQELENKLEVKKKLIDDFSTIINDHKLTHQVFALIEKLTHPKVVYTNFSIDPKNYQIKLSGETSNFQTLGEQIIIFRNNNEISSFSLSDVSSLKKEKLSYVKFTLNINLSPQVFILSSQ